jgi:hypothetical protein
LRYFGHRINIMTIQELQHLIRRLFEDDALAFFGTTDYSIAFALPGNAKHIMNKLLDHTDPSGWDGEAGHWFYQNDNEDWALYLRSIPTAVLCLATVRSLHLRHMDQYRVTQEQEALISADMEQSQQAHQAWLKNNVRTDELIPLGGPFYSDGERVWGRSQYGYPYYALNHIDLTTFRHLVDSFGADALGLRYYVEGSHGIPSSQDHGLIEGSDPATFELIGQHWYRDSHQAYYFESEKIHAYPIVVKTDVATLEHIGGAYARDARHLFCAGIRKRSIADPASVASLGGRYARIGTHILYEGKIVTRPGRIDVETARAAWDDLLIDETGHMLFGKNYRKPLKTLDAKSFRFLTQFFAVDDDCVYVRSNTNLVVCELADRASVQAAPPLRIRDKYGLIDIKYPEGAVRVREANQDMDDLPTPSDLSGSDP